MEEFKDIVKKNKEIKLTKEEKDSMRVRISAFVNLNNQKSLLANKTYFTELIILPVFLFMAVLC